MMSSLFPTDMGASRDFKMCSNETKMKKQNADFRIPSFNF